MKSDRLRWNLPAVTSETFDDEVVIVNFDTGAYHSLQGAGRLLWQRLEASATLEELQAFALSRFEGDRADIETAVRALVTTLTDEGLVAVTSVEPPAEPSAALSGEVPKVPFTAPALNTFSDMKELLWLDPIHEVDEAGWPITKTDDGR